ncbi:hypothetical protein C8P68_10438 [Mucilaginibacter yixingensis]|uniref:Uncharacterized protein n=1 Tax=Mucilaginibacter yixingensis TaxID=1295612 RepID=A0A2T5J962_9SPHI|nr:hypothetical protein [Mucilaginibacter yixingensis]PTQ96554.1 hypothetical protein C8P68_10438 [Mucilaginibacter yixingensis]
MKLTHYFTGFFAESDYDDRLHDFLNQYRHKFPGLDYLHIELSEGEPTVTVTESPSGHGLRISVSRLSPDSPLADYEMMIGLRNLLDNAVASHLQKTNPAAERL